MKILVLNYEFPPVGGGGGKVSEDICRMLAQKGHQIRVQTSYVKGLPKYEQRDGYQIFRSFTFRKYLDHCSVYEMAAYIVTNFFPALWLTITWKPDVMHVHFAVPTGIIGWLINFITGTPYILTVHAGDVPGGTPDQTDHLFRVIKPFTNPIWKYAAAITAVSNHIRTLALKAYHVPIKTIPNGVELKKCIQSHLYTHNPPRLVFAGRFNPEKNLLFLIDVLARVRNCKWEMDMLGDGRLMEDIKKRINKYNLENRIHLHGWVDSNRVDKLINQSDILLLPSLSEGFPVVGVKALGHGLAILGSKIGGISDLVIDGQNGFLCPVNDFNSFEQALRSMLLSKKKLIHMKMTSREMAEKFDLVKIADKYESIFVEVINNKRGTTR